MMSLITKQIDELRAYAKDRKGELAKLINDAADTIEQLSAKLHASQMERSSQYYHGGWIPCSERLPEESGRYLISVLDGVGRRTTVAPYQPRYKAWTMTGRMAYWKVIAWMPLPEPYREEGD